MEVFDFIRDKFSYITLFCWFLSVFGCIQLYYSIKCFVVQRRFFKYNCTQEKIRSRSNGTLLKYTLEIMNTMEKAKTDKIISLIAAIVFCGVIATCSETTIEIISLTVGVISLVTWLIISRYNNRIVRRIDEAKPSLMNHKDLQ